MNVPRKNDTATLEILEAIEQSSSLTQRHLAKRLGVALGLANSYLKRCARKGLIKVQQAPANRYLYYLTPKGFAEKSRLTGEYLAYSLSFYRRASDSVALLFSECRGKGYRTLALYGVSDLTEIAVLRAREFDLDVRGVLDPDAPETVLAGHPVWREVPRELDIDAWVVSDLRDPRGAVARLEREAGATPVLVPDVLGLSRATGRSMARSASR